MTDFAALTSEIATTTAPDDIVVDLAYADLLEEWAQEDRDDERLNLYDKKMAKVELIRQQLAPRMMHFHQARGRVNGTLRDMGNRGRNASR